MRLSEGFKRIEGSIGMPNRCFTPFNMTHEVVILNEVKDLLDDQNGKRTFQKLSAWRSFLFNLRQG